MKTLLVIFTFCCLYLPSNAQIYVNGEDITTLDINYLKATVYGRTLLNKEVRVIIDYGEFLPLNPRQDIGGEKNTRRRFASDVDLINFMDIQGWELVDTYIRISDSGSGPLNIIFKRKENRP